MLLENRRRRTALAGGRSVRSQPVTRAVAPASSVTVSFTLRARAAGVPSGSDTRRGHRCRRRRSAAAERRTFGSGDWRRRWKLAVGRCDRGRQRGQARLGDRSAVSVAVTVSWPPGRRRRSRSRWSARRQVEVCRHPWRRCPGCRRRRVPGVGHVVPSGSRSRPGVRTSQRRSACPELNITVSGTLGGSDGGDGQRHGSISPPSRRSPSARHVVGPPLRLQVWVGRFPPRRRSVTKSQL